MLGPTRSTATVCTPKGTWTTALPTRSPPFDSTSRTSCSLSRLGDDCRPISPNRDEPTCRASRPRNWSELGPPVPLPPRHRRPTWAEGGVPSERTATREIFGRSSRSSSTRLATSSVESDVTPVTLPPGRPRLSTSPSFTGSAPVAMTMGIVAVAFLAAWADSLPPVTRTSTRSRTNSAAKPGSRSLRPCAQRASKRMLRPSTYPNSWSACRRAVHHLPEGRPPVETDRVRRAVIEGPDKRDLLWGLLRGGGKRRSQKERSQDDSESPDLLAQSTGRSRHRYGAPR
jgi:hypothetical protein